jgi:hypothetical protein
VRPAGAARLVVASRGRLLDRVEAWNDRTAREFARAYAAHVRSGATRRAAEYAADAAAAAERRWQSGWLADRLGVRVE